MIISTSNYTRLPLLVSYPRPSSTSPYPNILYQHHTTRFISFSNISRLLDSYMHRDMYCMTSYSTNDSDALNDFCSRMDGLDGLDFKFVITCVLVVEDMVGNCIPYLLAYLRSYGVFTAMVCVCVVAVPSLERFRICHESAMRSLSL